MRVPVQSKSIAIIAAPRACKKPTTSMTKHKAGDPLDTSKNIGFSSFVAHLPKGQDLQMQRLVWL